MAKKQVTVSLGFTADTAKAKAQLNDLQRQLNQLSNSQNIKISTGNFDADIKKSISSVDELRSHLEAATNVNTGKLDLTKFKKSMDESGKTLKDYRDDLIALGPEGVKTFMSLGQSIMNAEVPLKRTNKLLNDMWDNLKKTAGWQLSSSAIHGLMGAMQSAYGYAQDLNTSLNDIRIVTGQSAEQMEKFAVRANKAAKSLSATTLDYTNAALIYYQQGLDDEKVQARADVTVKMANVTRENAEDVSSYMTAIWNNFDDGSHTLEYYADVMAKLGAETAASTEEIAAGLEKFAAIADTVGLSYEYATAAVATVVDKTRQSADTVGTSFKTIFSRLSSLSLGETLDDGVNLTKYTEALATVGVAALDANGDLRNMDDILDDLGRKWDTLADAEKNALAQTVAGVRQYNNLIAILDNYDSFKKNVGDALGSSGELQKQADIYAESWEGARDRVQAAAEDIYTSLLDDDFFILLLNFGADVLSILDKVIDGLGGLQGILFAVSNLMITFNKESMAKGLRDLAHNVKLYTGATQEEIRKTKEEYIANAKGALAGKEDTEYYHQFDAYLNDTADLQNSLLNISEDLTESQKKQIQLELDRNKALHENTLELAKQKDLASEGETEATSRARQNSNVDLNKFFNAKTELRNRLSNLNKKSVTDEDLIAAGFTKEQLDQKSEEQKAELKILYLHEQKNAAIEKFRKTTGATLEDSWELARSMEKTEKTSKDLEKSQENVNKHTKETNDKINQAGKKTKDWADHTMVLADNFTTIGAIISNIQGLWRAFTDDTMTFGDRVVAITSSFAMLIPLIMKITSLKNVTDLADFATAALAHLTLEKNITKEKKEQNKENIKETTLETTNLGIKKAEEETEKNITDEKKEQNKETFKENVQEGLDEAGDVISKKKVQFDRLKESLKGILGVLKITPKMLGWFAVGVAAVGAAAYATAKHIDNTTISAKEQEQAAKDAAEGVQATTAAYEEVTSTIDGLKGQVKTLEDMERGTSAWRVAVAQLNGDLVGLLEKYNLLGEYTVKYINGIPTIVKTSNPNEDASEEVYNKIAEKAENNMISSQFHQAVVTTKDKNTITDRVTSITNATTSRIENEGLAPAEGEDYYTFYKRIYDETEIALESYKDAVETGAEIAEDQQKILNSIGDEDKSTYLKATNPVAESHMTAAYGILNKYGYSEEDFGSGGYNVIAEGIAEYVAAEIDKLTDKEIMSKTVTTQDKKDYAEQNSLYYDSQDDKFYTDESKTTEKDVQDETLKMFVASMEILAKAFNEEAVKTMVGNIQTEKSAEIDQANKDYNNVESEAFQSKTGKDARTLVTNEGLDPNDLDEYTDRLIENNKELKKYQGQTKMAAAEIMRMNKGLGDLQENFEENSKVIKDGEKDTEAYSKAMGEMKENVADVLGVTDAGILTDKFIIENLKDIEAAANGDVEAIERLRDAAGQDLLMQVVGATDFSQVDEDIRNLHNDIGGYKFEVGVTMNSGEFFEKCNEIVQKAGMTATEATNYFKEMGYDVVLEETTVAGTQSVSRQTGRWFNTSTHKWEEVDGEITTVEGEKKALAVKSITSRGSAGGTVDYKNTKRGGASTSKGGGGSKSKKEHKSSSDEIDRYHEITKTIEDLNDTLDKLDKKKSRAFDKGDLIQQEIDKTKEMIELQKQYLKEIETNLGKDRANIAKYGAKFDKNGNISNYEEIYQKELDAYNKAVDKYNKNGDEKAFEKAEKRFEEFKKFLKQYEETEELFDETNKGLDDLLYTLEDKFLEAVQNDLNVQITISEDTKKYLDYLLKKTDYSSFSAAKRISIYNKQMAETFNQIESQSKAVFDLLDKKGKTDIYDKLINGEVDRKQLQDMGFTDAEIEQIFDSLGEIWDGNLEVLELNKKVAEEIGKAIDEKMAVIDKQIGKMQFLSGLAGKFRDIVNLTGQDVLGVTDELMNGALDAQLKANTNILETSKAKLDELKSDREKVQKAIEEAKARGEDTTELEKQLDDIDERIQQSTNDFMDSWQTALETAAQIFDESMQQAIDRFGTAIAGAAGNLDNLQTLMDRQSEIDDRYLEDYAKIYELTKLNRDITNSIDNTDNIKGKRELMKLQEEINALQESNTEMSQYEVDQLRAKYDLRLAEIALEEAQNAKSQVRMTRDSEGNWSYTYTADQDNVDSAQQNYEDKLYAMQELNSNYIKEMEQQMASIAKQMQDELLSLDKTSADYQERYNEIVAYYNDKLGYYTEQINKALGNNQELYEKDWKDYSEKTGYKLSATENFVTQFSETMLGMSTGFNSALDFQKTFNESSDKLLQESAEAFNKWKTTIDEVCKAAGTSLEGFKDLFNEVVNGDGKDKKGIKDLSKEAADAAKESLENLSTYIDDILTKIAEVFEEFGKKIKEAKDGTVSISDEQKKKTEDEKKKKDEEDKKEKQEKEEKKNDNIPTLTVGNAVSVKEGTRWYYDAQGNGPSGMAKAGTIKYVSPNSPYGYNIDGLGWVKKTDIVGYDTGGYTGRWGNSGRLGILHEKELVLNADDTENFLNGIMTLRDITNLIDLKAKMMSQEGLLGSLIGGAPGIGQNMEQHIEIYAEFPDATYQDEIRDAFQTLINQASQYANRRG